MAEARLKTHLQVSAAVRLGSGLAIPVTVARKGEPDSGSVAIKLVQARDRVSVLVQFRDMDGKLHWMRATGPEPKAEAECDAYLEKAIRRDPDLWVVEIEDRDGRHLFDGVVK